MWNRGRLLLAVLGLAREQSLLGVVYFPSGTSGGIQAERAAFHEALLTELSSWRQVPCLLTGDWISDVAGNITAAALTREGWKIPPLCSHNERAMRTFTSPACTAQGGTILDYWISSRHFQNLHRQEVGSCPKAGHAPVEISIPKLPEK